MQRKNKNRFIDGLIIGIILASFVSMIAILPYIKMIQKENMIESLIKKEYVDIDEVDFKEVRDSLYSGMFNALDDYSYYYTKDEFHKLNNSIKGNYSGIGVVVSYSDNLNCLVIRQVYDNSPAKEAKLKKDDTILEINGKSTRNLKDVDVATTELKGKENTKVKLLVESKGEKREIEVERKAIAYDSTKTRIIDGIGYLRIYTFDKKTSKEVKEDLEEFKNKGIEKVILDIRNNQGGLIESLIDTLEEIVPKQLVMITKDKEGREVKYYTDKGKDIGFKYVLLVNKETASCAEIFASLMKNEDYATIVGVPTYGKGSAQSIIPLVDGTGIKLTTEKWYDNKGNSIDKVGVIPDIRVRYKYLGDDEFEEDEMQDTQVLKALEIIKE